MKKRAQPQSDLFKPAHAALKNAYSPYSGFKVGAAIRLKSGKVVSGCNVENSSFGATVCAERVAVQTAIAQFGKIRLKEVFVLTESNPPWPPCGMCRQVLSEFAEEDLLVTVCNTSGVTQTFCWHELYPEAFTPAALQKKKKSLARRK